LVNYALFGLVVILAIGLIGAYFYIRQRRRTQGAFVTDSDIDSRRGDVANRDMANRSDTRYGDTASTTSTTAATTDARETARRP